MEPQMLEMLEGSEVTSDDPCSPGPRWSLRRGREPRGVAVGGRGRGGTALPAPRHRDHPPPPGRVQPPLQPADRPRNFVPSSSPQICPFVC